MVNPAVWNFADTYEWMDRVTHGSLAPLMITCAVNGGIHGREANPAVPETPEEIAREAQRAFSAGAVAVHIHGRQRGNLAATADEADVYEEINFRVRELCPDIIINNTTGGGPTATRETRLDCLSALPEMASLSLGPVMARNTVGPRRTPLPHPHDGLLSEDSAPLTYGEVGEFVEKMRGNGIKPELEIHHGGHYWVVRDLIEKGLIEPPYAHQFVMGFQTATFPTVANVAALVSELPSGSIYSMVGLGPFHLPMASLSILMGGHVRVGLEDTIYYSGNTLATGNAELIERVVRLAREMNREIATPAQAREMLGLGEPRRYERR
jgi:3-keto-5-aminohexanoate cleavage enzyme